jgi:hypothetical protein
MLIFINLEFGGNTCLEMNAKSYSNNSPREFIHGKPAMFCCKLWSVCGNGGHCFMYKEGRYGLSTAKYLEQMHWTFWTLGTLHLCPVANTILAETRQDDLLSLPC